MNADRPQLLRSLLRTTLVIPATVAIYGLLLYWAYTAFIVPNYKYMGYTFVDPDLGVLLLNWVFASIAASVIPKTFRKVSALVLWLIYARVIAPILLMSPYIGYLDGNKQLYLAIALTLTFSIVCLGVRGTPKSLGMSVSYTSLTTILLCISSLTYLIIFATLGFQFQFVDLLSVYDVRDEWKAGTEGLGIIHYLRSWQASAINPLIFALGIYQRRYWISALAILGQYLLYTSTGFKGTLFLILAWFLVALLLRVRNSKIDGLILVWGMMGLVLITNFLDAVTNSLFWSSLFTRRFLVTPSMLTNAYVDFFDENPKAYLGHSIFSSFVDYAYEQSIPRVIGGYLGFPEMAANTNMFADGFANFGWIGIPIVGLLFLFILRLADRASFGLPIMVSGIVLTGPAMNLSDSGILTTLLTHGLIVAIVLLAITPRPNSKTPSNDAKPSKRLPTTKTNSLTLRD